MNKLELKHIAPYLPYKLKVMFPCEIETPELNTDTLMGLEKSYDESDNWLGLFDEFETVNMDNFKPILHPLSDLKVEQDRFGNYIGKMRELSEIYWKDNMNSDLENCVNEERFNEVIIQSPLLVSYNILLKLFEWHFDVFGLIKNGLAIDINTI